MKKLGKWKSFDFGPDQTPKETLEEPLKKNHFTTKLKPLVSSNKIIQKRIDFHTELIPKTPADLSVHPKKIKELESWLEENVLKVKAAFLLLSGPTGSGKTTTLSVLCKTMGINILEWVNPMDLDFEVFHGASQLSRFTEFLKMSKWNTLFETEGQKKVILVKDFPNVVIKNPEGFHNILEEFSYDPKYPVVFICTEASQNSINLPRLLFPEAIKQKFGITHISFNPCAITIMNTSIKRAQCILSEHPDLYKMPSNSTIEAIVTSSMGDIRNAMNQLHLASLLGTKDIPTVSEKTGTKRKRNGKSITKIQHMNKDEALGLFHGLGRILNPKRKEVDGSWRLDCDVEKLVDEFSIQPSSFQGFLHENYLKYFGDLTDVARAADSLSLSTLFLEKWTDRHETLVFSVWINTLGLMVSNEHKVRKFTQIRAPRKSVKCVERHLETRGLSTTDYYYYNIIKKSDKFHRFIC